MLFATIYLWALALAADAPAAARPLEASRPYVVHATLDLPDTGAPSGLREDLERSLQRLSQQVLGRAWTLDFPEAQANPEISPPIKEPGEKWFWIQLRRSRRLPAWEIEAREYDALVGAWGPAATRSLRRDGDLDSEVLGAMLDAFRPVARVVGRERGVGELDLVGSIRLSQSSGQSIVSAGTPFQIVRQHLEEENRMEIVPWSYLTLLPEDAGGSPRITRRAEIVSVFRDPLTRRSRKKIELWGIACPPASPDHTVVTFLNRADDRPIVGYEVAVRLRGQPATFTLGATDDQGRANIGRLERGSTRANSRVLDVMLKSGQTVVARFPLVPGTPAELTAKASTDPLLAEVAGATLALQEEVVDLAARRKIMELRLEKAAQEEQLEAARHWVDEINAMPNRVVLAERLEEIRSWSEQRSKDLKQKSVGPDVQRLLAQTERLLEAVPKDKLAVEQVDTPADSPPSPPAP